MRQLTEEREGRLQCDADLFYIHNDVVFKVVRLS